MRCINKRTRRQRRKRLFHLTSVLVLILVFLCLGGIVLKQNDISVQAYEEKTYRGGVYSPTLEIDNLCVTNLDVSSEHFKSDDDFHAILLFDTSNANVIYAENIHERLFPASTTKIMTSYLALKYGDLEDIVTVSSNAVGVPLDSSRAYLKTGDQLTLKALLYSLMLPSGNDSAVAIAEHISGSVDAFAKLMNDEAKRIGATNSNFINPHGYQDKNHYTTAYDLYLIFNKCLEYDEFCEIISASRYSTKITQKNGTYREVTWMQSNQFVNGNQKGPEGLSIVGGKTGTTDEAGACLLLSSYSDKNSYISIIMGADSRPILYENMNDLISSALASE